MKLNHFKSLLQANPTRNFQIQLPGEALVPLSFHITEVGYVTKKFIDCGGKVHTIETCQLQAWVGDDVDHRIEAGKMAKILELAQALLPHDFLDLEVEYEDAVISQYTVESADVTEDAVILQLAHKHTDCLAKELCLVPSSCGTVGCC